MPNTSPSAVLLRGVPPKSELRNVCSELLVSINGRGILPPTLFTSCRWAVRAHLRADLARPPGVPKLVLKPNGVAPTLELAVRNNGGRGRLAGVVGVRSKTESCRGVLARGVVPICLRPPLARCTRLFRGNSTMCGCCCCCCGCWWWWCCDPRGNSTLSGVPGALIDPWGVRIASGLRETLLNRFIQSLLRLIVRFPHDRMEFVLDLAEAFSEIPWINSPPREPRVRVIKTRTAMSRHNCAIPSRFSRVTSSAR